MAGKRCDGIETKGKLLAAASRIFSEVGFHDATIAHICRTAGANVAAVNYYFGSKESLYVEAWRHVFELSIAKFPPDGGVPASASAEDRLCGMIRALVLRVIDKESLDFDIVHKEMANPTGLLTEVMKDSLNPLRNGLTNVIREILGPDVDEEVTQFCEMSVHAQCFGLLRRMRRFKDKPYHPMPELNPKDAVEHICRFSLAGIRSVGKTS